MNRLVPDTITITPVLSKFESITIMYATKYGRKTELQ